MPTKKNPVKAVKQVVTALDEALLDDARKLMQQDPKGFTASRVQKNFRIGFARATKIYETLTAEKGILKVTAVEPDTITVQNVAAAPEKPVLTVDAEVVSTAIVPVKKKAAELKTKHDAQREEENLNGKKVLSEIDTILSESAVLEGQLEQRYVRFGALLLAVTQNEYFRSVEREDEEGQVAPCTSMSQYIAVIAEKWNRSVRSLYYYMSTIKALAPSVSFDELNKMGLQKARKLATITRQVETLPDKAVVAAVIEAKTVADVDELLHKKYLITKTEEQKGTWYPMDGFYVEDNDRALLDEMFKKAFRMLKLNDTNTSVSFRRREALKLWAAEFANVPEKSTE